MACDEIAHDPHICFIDQGLKIDGLEIAAFLGKVSLLVEHVRHATAHPRGEIPAAGTEYNHQSVGHVFTTMVSNALDDRRRTGIADREAFSGNSVEKRLAARSAVQGHIADDDVLFRREAGTARRIYDKPSTRKALSDIVVGFALERERDPVREERSQTLAG